MSPDGHSRSGKAAISSNIYTVVLALALGVVVATAAFVAYKCYFQYETIFKIP
jgi:hypothetical protein